MIYFHTFKNPGLVIDIVSDIRSVNQQAVFAKKTGVIILGGGIIKHHICNANLMVTVLILTKMIYDNLLIVICFFIF